MVTIIPASKIVGSSSFRLGNSVTYHTESVFDSARATGDIGDHRHLQRVNLFITGRRNCSDRHYGLHHLHPHMCNLVDLTL